MPDYAVGVAPRAERRLKKLPRAEQRKVAKVLLELTMNPRPRGVEKLAENPAFWRIRAGNYRVIYHIDDKKKFVAVADIRDRKDVYRNLSALDPAVIVNSIKEVMDRGRQSSK